MLFFGTYEIMAKIKYDKFPSSQKKLTPDVLFLFYKQKVQI